MSYETLRRVQAGIALAVGTFAALSPRHLLRMFGVAPGEVTGAADLGWRLFAVRTAAIGARAMQGDETARAALLPVQVADQAVFVHALRTNAVPRRTAALAMATSGVIIVLDLLSRARSR